MRADRSGSSYMSPFPGRDPAPPPVPTPGGRSPTASAGAAADSGGLGAGRLGIRGERGPGGLDQGGEGGGLIDGQLGQDATVQLDAGELEPLHEPVVGHVVQPGRGVDAGDPQLAEVTLARLAVAVVVGRRVEQLLLGLAVQPRTLTAVTGGGLEGRPALLLGVDRPLHACHVSTPVFSSVEGGQRPSSFFMRGASDGDSTPMPLTRRLREEDFTSNLCWLLVCSRTSFPLPVTRTRFAAPLWVFCFGMSLVLFVCRKSWWPSCRAPPRARERWGAGGSSVRRWAPAPRSRMPSPPSRSGARRRSRPGSGAERSP